MRARWFELESVVTEQTKATPTAHEVVERFLSAALDPAGGNLADLYGASVVIEMPFAPPGIPQRSETSGEELRTRFQAGAGAREYQKIDSVVIHQTADPEVVIVEYDVHGKVVATGKQFVLSYICVMTIRDGKIVHSRDYTNPITGARALGMLPQLIELLSQESE
ncbi:nuclear transport factor 2 family protein [Nonomuraea antimicrobica]|uniref:Nuclear transport factor 2 family protein n=1 Tax=Nonomuraea antimicrobica TaxID=561173 RepID=A0ABP7B4W2_9ACTN